jgi:hypothetical protein
MRIRKPRPNFSCLVAIALLLIALVTILALSTKHPTPAPAPASNLTLGEVACSACGGSGRVHAPADWIKSHPEDTGEYVCWACGGTGILLKEPASSVPALAPLPKPAKPAESPAPIAPLPKPTVPTVPTVKTPTPEPTYYPQPRWRIFRR